MDNYTKEELYELLHNSHALDVISNALLYITFNINDVDWVEDCCLSLIDSDNEDISGLAITCLGHVARIHSKINKQKVIPALISKRHNHNLAGRVEDALDDINMFAIN
ncbi:hypothetical protein [Rahnella laticis]|uniref:hypothetical protein n=1 Tax=Rahnella laticis TaxID=2787622 RepID=UPI0018A330BD|nr:hypothetical protein [Rahnella laticis]MBF7996281.1 hypothetical protein [Rahnella laticis]